MAQWVKVLLATGPEDLIWIPGTDLMLEGKLTPHSCRLSSTCVLCHVCTYIHMHKMFKNNSFIEACRLMLVIPTLGG